MPSNQLTLDADFESVSQKVDDGSILAAFLWNQKAWMTRSEVAQQLKWNERRIRAAGEYSCGKIIFGQRGMRHIRFASIEEVNHCCLVLNSQAKRNADRAVEIRREFHAWGATGKAI
jgi:hypothetical protein